MAKEEHSRSYWLCLGWTEPKNYKLKWLQIPIDFLHALFALDYFHGRRYERESELWGEEKSRKSSCSSITYPQTIDSASPDRSSFKSNPTFVIVPLAVRPARTYHPILASYFSPLVRFVLLTIHDILLGTLLLAHISAFFRLLEPNSDACDSYTSPYPETLLDPTNTSMSVLERCRRINVDMYVSGGFAVAIYCILLAMHCWHLGFRMWELGIFGIEKDYDMGVDEEEEEIREETRTMDGAQERREQTGGRDMWDGRQSTAIELSELDTGGRRTRGRLQSKSEDQKDNPEATGSIGWNEMLLECLVP